MIVGSGDIAHVLPDMDDKLFFASGVSNSKEDRPSEFDREMKLLLDQGTRPRLVYFSSLAVLYANTPYTRHKRNMEDTVKANFPRYCIIRIGNITFGDNPHTIINYFKDRIKESRKLDIQNVYRYVIDLDEFLHWIYLIPDWNVEMNCPGRMMKVSDIVEEIKLGAL